MNDEENELPEPPDGEDEENGNGQTPPSLEALLPRLYRDPRYMLIGKNERFGRALIAFIESCTVLSATGDLRGQMLLNREFEMEGRPDGERPYGRTSLVDHYLDRSEEHPSFSDEEFSALREESWLYYVRRNFMMLLEEYALARDDAEHNLSLWHLIDRSDASEGAKWSYLKWWPWIERDRALAQALVDLEEHPDHAATELYRAHRGILQFGERYQEEYAQEEGDGQTLCTHMAGHLTALTEVLRRDRNLPVSLDEQLDEAEGRGDTEEVERIRREMIRRTMEGEE